MNHWIKNSLKLVLLIVASTTVAINASDENESTVTTSVTTAPAAEEISQGNELAFNRKKGNCLACHYIQGGTLMGTTGPALIAMKQRFPEKAKLKAQIYDARINNENTIMPPFGAHGALTEKEIDLIVDWLYTI